MVHWKKDETDIPKKQKLRRSSYCATCAPKSVKVKSKGKDPYQRRFSTTAAKLDDKEDEDDSEEKEKTVGDEKPPTAIKFTWDQILPEKVVEEAPRRKLSMAQIFAKSKQPKISDSMALKILQIGKPGDKSAINTVKEEEVNASFQGLFQKLSMFNSQLLI